MTGGQTQESPHKAGFVAPANSRDVTEGRFK